MAKNNRNITTENLSYLKKEIGKTLKRKVESHRDCEILAKVIENDHGLRIGITTLRRFFGLDPSKTLPSTYTLDTLSVFCGYNSWPHFINMIDEKKRKSNGKQKSLAQNDKSAWQLIKDKADSVTGFIIKALKKKSGIPFEHVLLRKFAVEKIDGFLNSDKFVTAFIGPGGYGKTCILTKSVEHFWKGPNALYPDDIVWMIDASLLSGMITKNFDFLSWFASQVGLGYNDNYREYFTRNPAERKGRMILIIDNIDRLSKNIGEIDEFYTAFINFIASNDETPWFKIIFSIRNITWNIFLNILKEYPKIQEFWYNVNFQPYIDDYTNIAPLDNEEIEEIIHSFAQKLPFHLFVELENMLLSGDFDKFLSYPYYLQVFYRFIADNKKIPQTVTFLVIEFIRLKISSGINGEFKQEIIEKILDKINYATSFTTVPKKKIIGRNTDKAKLRAYDELLSYGILREDQHYNKYGTMTNYIRFAHSNLLEFMIATHYVSRTTDFNLSMVESIISSYQNSPYKEEILIWVIRLAFYEKNYELIYELKTIFQKQHEMLGQNDFLESYYGLINTIGVHLRYNKIAGDFLIPRFSIEPTWNKLYFETFIDLDYIVLGYWENVLTFLKYNKDNKSKIFGYSILLMKGIFELNLEEAAKYCGLLEKITHDIKTTGPVNLGRSLSMRVIYYFLVNGKITDSLNDDLKYFESRINSEGSREEQAIYFSYLIGAMNYINRYDLSISYWEQIKGTFDNLSVNYRTAEYNLVKLLVADAYLVKGEPELCRQMLNAARINELKGTRNSFAIYYNMVHSRLSYTEGRKSEAVQYIEKAGNIASKFGFTFFEKMAEETLKIYETSRMNEFMSESRACFNDHS